MIDIARHQRLLPGDGVFPLQQLLACLREKQYQGPLGLEVFNDELKKQPGGCGPAGDGRITPPDCLRRRPCFPGRPDPC